MRTMVLAIIHTPGCEDWCLLNMVDISEKTAYRLKWELIKAGATREIVEDSSDPHGDYREYITLRG